MTFSVVPRDKQQVLALVETELGSYILFGVCAVVVPSPIIHSILKSTTATPAP